MSGPEDDLRGPPRLRLPKLWLPRRWFPRLGWPWHWAIHVWQPHTGDGDQTVATQRWLFLLGLGFCLFCNTAIPGLAIPTLGQAIWTTGFSQSFANAGPLALYAHNFGYPTAPPIVFGLAGAKPIAWLIGLGVPPVEAYVWIQILWLCAAFAGAWVTARRLTGDHRQSTALATVWCSLPLVWNHSGYSFLAMGFALLPAYLGTVLALVQADRPAQLAVRSLVYLAATLTAVFMDGYTFVMFAVGGLAIWAYALLVGNGRRVRLSGVVLPVLLVGLGAAFKAYSRYVGTSEFVPSPLSVFRGWGVDLAFLLQPSKDMMWLWDFLHVSARRTTVEQFGDESVWVTTFSAPLWLAAGWAAWQSRRKPGWIAVFAALALFGLWMSLGPNLKVWSERPLALRAHPEPHMEATEALWRTGNGWISNRLPGFRNMRASYRWLGLAFAGIWLLLAAWAPAAKRRVHVKYLLLFLMLSNMPHPYSKLRRAMSYHDEFAQLDRDVTAAFSTELHPGERVAFLPHGNDFLINYVAARLQLRALNVGGDKNKETAARAWPEALQALPEAKLGPAHLAAIRTLLTGAEVDAVVIPYVNLLWSAHEWPCYPEKPSDCPDVLRIRRQASVAELAADPQLQVTDSPLGAIVRRR